MQSLIIRVYLIAYLPLYYHTLAMQIQFASLCLLLAGLCTVPARPLRQRSVATEFPDPNQDPFYKAPSNLASYKLGQVIRSRKVVTTVTSSSIKPSYQLYYRTTNTQNGAEGTVATVLAPTSPKSPAQILSYHAYQDSDSFDCSPSWALVNGSKSDATGTTGSDLDVYVDFALSNGIYAIVPDDEGSSSTFIAGYQQGVDVLDGLRAIKNFYKLPSKAGIAMAGYSGGASVTVWAADLAGSYAPDLNILGVAHGGTPISTKDTFNYLNKGVFAGFAGAGLVGLMNAYPSLNKYVLQHYTAAGLTYIDKYRGNNECEGNVSTSAPLVDFLSFFNVADPLDQPVIKTVLARETLLMSESSGKVAVPTFPRLQWHALEDEIIPYTVEAQFVTEQCQHGANIQFQTFPAAEHITAQYLGIPGAVQFLGQLFNHTTPKVVCGTPLPSYISLTSPLAASIIGQPAVSAFLSLNGSTILGEKIIF
jgi:hypothetical protein